MKLGIPVYDGVNLLDVAGPYEMFNWVDSSKGLETVILSANGGSVKTMNGIRFEAHGSFCSAPALDVLWVPGGDPTVLGEIMSDPGSEYLAYLRQVAAGRNGSARYARARCCWRGQGCRRAQGDDALGLLRMSEKFPGDHGRYSSRALHRIGQPADGGGISSGLDEALKLIMLLFDRETAEAVQLSTQYFPDPPVSSSIPPAPACPRKMVTQWG